MVQMGRNKPSRQEGRIVRLEIEDFKSYRGKQQIGPFKAFTAVVGPNGSGKSNLMDAISFVLGVRTTHLRGSLKELLHSSGTQPPAKRAAVRLVYEPSAGEELIFSRAIVPSSSSGATYVSQYKIDSQQVSADAYNERLISFNVLVKARNFLVFQVSLHHSSVAFTILPEAILCSMGLSYQQNISHQGHCHLKKPATLQIEYSETVRHAQEMLL